MEIGENTNMNNKVVQPIRIFKSSGKKIALQIGIVSVYVCFFGYYGMKSKEVVDRVISLSFLLIVAAFILWRHRPVWVELYTDRIKYRAFLGKEQEVFFTQMKSIDYWKKIYKIRMIFPVYGHTKYSIYVEKENGKKKKLNMNSLSGDDFSIILNRFLQNVETREEIEMREKVKSPYFCRKFSLPVQKLRDTYYYIGKKIGNPLLKVSLAGAIVIFVVEFLCNIPVFDRIKENDILMILYVLAFMIPVTYFVLWLTVYRESIENSGKVPMEVYVCQEYMEINKKKFAFEKITDGYVVCAKFHCERVIEFMYEERRFTFHFGKYRSFLPDYFSQYAILEAYLRGRGFERWIR